MCLHMCHHNFISSGNALTEVSRTFSDNAISRDSEDKVKFFFLKNMLYPYWDIFNIRPIIVAVGKFELMVV